MITTGLPGTLLDLLETTLAQMLLDKERPLLLELQFTELLIRLYDVLVPLSPEEEEKPKALADTLTHMEENFFRDLGLEDLAAHSGWSVEYFSRTFKRHLGLTALEYLHQLRIRRACYLLKHTPQKILDISLEVGYNNVSFFNRYFRRLMGISPSEYRS